MWLKNARYLDYNAGAGLHPKVQEELKQLLSDPEFFAANPSSRHQLGQKMQHLLYRSGRKVAHSFGELNPDHLTFTSSGTEANQTVIRSALAQGMAVFIGAGEHSASFDLMGNAREIPLLPNGQCDLEQLHNLLAPGGLADEKGREIQQVLLSLFWANNETGVLHDFEALSKTLTTLRSRFPQIQFFLHLDGAQVWGKLPLVLPESPADWVTFSAHKIGAPAGTGVIWSRKLHSLKSLIVGAQAQGQRGGTENWLGIFAAGIAAEHAASTGAVQEFQLHTAALRDRFEKTLRATGLPVTIWGESAPRIGNTSRFSFDDFKTYQNWVELLDLRGFAVSHGSACKSQVIEPSRVLLKMGASEDAALNSLRVSFGPGSDGRDADELVAQLTELYHNKKKSS